MTTAAIVAVLAVAVAFLIHRSRARTSARRVGEKQFIEERVPPDLRGHSSAAVALLVAAFPAMVAGAFVGAAIAGRAGGVVGVVVLSMAFVVAALVRERAHRSAVIQEVERRAATMDAGELGRLIEGPEAIHGRAPMQRLRMLLGGSIKAGGQPARPAGPVTRSCRAALYSGPDSGHRPQARRPAPRQADWDRRRPYG